MLVQLKLASGMTNPGWMKDLADVQELIKLRGLPRDFIDQLDPFVHANYLGLWDATQAAPDQLPCWSWPQVATKPPARGYPATPGPLPGHLTWLPSHLHVATQPPPAR